MERKMPPLQENITYTDLGDGIINIATPPVGFQQYLVLGEKRALLVDTGMGVGSIREVVDRLTALPVTVINTHGHPDHCGGNAEFDPPLMCPAEFDVYEKMATKAFRIDDVGHMPGGEKAIEKLQPDGPAPVPVADGEIIDLGGRTLKVLYTPGHTHGSICIYDEKTGALFTGDNVQAMTTTLREWNSGTVEDLAESLKKAAALKPTKILGGHRPNVNEPELLGRVLACAEDVLNGAEYTEHTGRNGQPCLFYEKDGVSIEFTGNNIRK